MIELFGIEIIETFDGEICDNGGHDSNTKGYKYSSDLNASLFKWSIY